MIHTYMIYTCYDLLCIVEFPSVSMFFHTVMIHLPSHDLVCFCDLGGLRLCFNSN